MTEAAPAPAAAKAARKKLSRPKGTSLSELIVKVVSASDERSGVSTTALKKALTAGGYDVEKNNNRVKNAIKSLVTQGTLVQIKGIGALGSFRMSKTAVEKLAKKAAPTVKKPAAPAKKSHKKTKKPAAAKKTKTTAVKKHVCVMQPMGDGVSFSCMADVQGRDPSCGTGTSASLSVTLRHSLAACVTY